MQVIDSSTWTGRDGGLRLPTFCSQVSIGSFSVFVGLSEYAQSWGVYLMVGPHSWRKVITKKQWMEAFA